MVIVIVVHVYNFIVVTAKSSSLAEGSRAKEASLLKEESGIGGLNATFCCFVVWRKEKTTRPPAAFARNSKGQKGCDKKLQEASTCYLNDNFLSFLSFSVSHERCGGRSVCCFVV
jgi:hypothetical protein